MRKGIIMRTCDMKTTTLQALTCATTLLSCCLFVSAASAEEPSLYMGGPVTLVEAPNGAIANKRILDGGEKVGWFKPTIEQPVEGVWVLGGYGLAPMSIIDTDRGLPGWTRQLLADQRGLGLRRADV